MKIQALVGGVAALLIAGAAMAQDADTSAPPAPGTASQSSAHHSSTVSKDKKGNESYEWSEETDTKTYPVKPPPTTVERTTTVTQPVQPPVTRTEETTTSTTKE